MDKRDRGLNLAPPVYQLWVQYRSATGEAKKEIELFCFYNYTLRKKNIPNFSIISRTTPIP